MYELFKRSYSGLVLLYLKSSLDTHISACFYPPFINMFPYTYIWTPRGHLSHYACSCIDITRALSSLPPSIYIANRCTIPGRRAYPSSNLPSRGVYISNFFSFSVCSCSESLLNIQQFFRIVSWSIEYDRHMISHGQIDNGGCTRTANSWTLRISRCRS